MSERTPKGRKPVKKTEVGNPKPGVGSQKSEEKIKPESPPIAGRPTPTKQKESRTRSQETREEKPEAKELQTQNSPLSTEQMEVHHHPEIEKKGVKEYLLEGFMIFIAVMMGFFAENIRENISNREHARQLTSQLVQDLKADTAHLNRAYRFQSDIVKVNDSLFTLLQQPLAKADLGKIQELIIRSHSLWPFHPTGGASAAIKNELHLKEFAESKIISHIADYEGNSDLAHTVQDIYLQYQRSMLDPFLRQHFTPMNLDAAFSHKPLPDAHMRNLTQADLTQLGADMVLIKVVSGELVRDYGWVRDSATKLLQYVQKQYDLEE
jgi:hypothetical protein